MPASRRTLEVVGDGRPLGEVEEGASSHTNPFPGRAPKCRAKYTKDPPQAWRRIGSNSAQHAWDHSKKTRQKKN